MEHVSIERMNEALDGVLASSGLERLERHLAECDACRNEYARLSEVVSDLRALPRTARVPEDAWAGISERIAATVADSEGDHAPAGEASATVIALPTARSDARSETGRARRFSLSVGQLAAAAALVALLSATTVWVALDGGSSATTPLADAGAPAPGGAAVRAVSLEDGRYAETVERLEQILETGRSVLTPETLVTIEESLRTVDSAIAEIETALAEDPNSDLLLRMLANHRSTRLGVLERAAAAVQAQT